MLRSTLRWTRTYVPVSSSSGDSHLPRTQSRCSPLVAAAQPGDDGSRDQLGGESLLGIEVRWLVVPLLLYSQTLHMAFTRVKCTTLFADCGP